MNRRNLLVSIGTAAVGSGAVLGSGALTNVQAERTMNVGVSGDASAAIALSANSDVAAVTNGGGGSSSLLTIDLSDNLNDNAVTTYGVVDDTSGDGFGTGSDNTISDGNEAFTVTNNSTEDVTLDVSIPSSSNYSDDITFWADTDTGDGTLTELTSNSITLTTASSGNSANVAIVIDTTDSPSDADDTGGSESVTVTFEATASSTP